MKLYIKYMVSLRCKMVVKEALEKLGLHYIILELGSVDIMDDLTNDQCKELHQTLLKSGKVLNVYNAMKMAKEISRNKK